MISTGKSKLFIESITIVPQSSPSPASDLPNAIYFNYSDGLGDRYANLNIPLADNSYTGSLFSLTHNAENWILLIFDSTYGQLTYTYTGDVNTFPPTTIDGWTADGGNAGSLEFFTFSTIDNGADIFQVGISDPPSDGIITFIFTTAITFFQGADYLTFEIFDQNGNSIYSDTASNVYLSGTEGDTEFSVQPPVDLSGYTTDWTIKITSPADIFIGGKILKTPQTLPIIF